MDAKNKKPRWRLNAVDIVIIAVVLAAAAALLYLWRASGKSSDAAANTKPVHYTIELNNMAAGTAQKIKPGDTIVDSEKKFVMGTVESVAILPATTQATDYQTGNTLTVENPGRDLAQITLVSDCSTTDNQIRAASGYVISVGKEVHAAGPGYAGIGYIIGIDREDVGE